MEKLKNKLISKQYINDTKKRKQIGEYQNTKLLYKKSSYARHFRKKRNDELNQLISKKKIDDKGKLIRFSNSSGF